MNIVDNLYILKDQYESMIYGATQELIKQIMKEDPSIKVITVRGFTPDWNDGETCEHHSSFYVNGCTEYGNQYVDTLKIDLPEEKPNWLSEDVIKWLDYFTETFYGTNFEIHFYEDEIEVNSYECGY